MTRQKMTTAPACACFWAGGGMFAGAALVAVALGRAELVGLNLLLALGAFALAVALCRAGSR